MTIVLPRGYHGRTALETSGVLCIDQGEAVKEDIRALRVGILNIMPRAESYEFSLLHPLGRSILQIEPIWIRLKNHIYASTDQGHLDGLYITFEEAIAQQPLDGLILTGAPVEEIPFEEVSYWDEIVEIMTYSREQVTSSLGICWGGLALAKHLGIEKEPVPRKIFGVFETKNLDRSNPITGDLDDVFWCPQSRHSGISDAVMENARDAGIINLLAYAPQTGYTIFESTDKRFIMHTGHPEYEPHRLVEESLRDQKKARADVGPPENFDINNPLNRWRGHRTEFFGQWIKWIHDTISF